MSLTKGDAWVDKKASGALSVTIIGVGSIFVSLGTSEPLKDYVVAAAIQMGLISGEQKVELEDLELLHYAPADRVLIVRWAKAQTKAMPEIDRGKKMITKKEAIEIADAAVREQSPEMLDEPPDCPHKLGKPKRKVEDYKDDEEKAYWWVVYTRPVEIHDGGKKPFKTIWRTVIYVDKKSGECMFAG